MSNEVKVTMVAVEANTRFKNVLSGSLLTEITNLEREGDTLSNPQNWDGQLARTFRNDLWPNLRDALRRTRQELENLQTQSAQIHKQIENAGGGF